MNLDRILKAIVYIWIPTLPLGALAVAFGPLLFASEFELGIVGAVFGVLWLLTVGLGMVLFTSTISYKLYLEWYLYPRTIYADNGGDSGEER